MMARWCWTASVVCLLMPLVGPARAEPLVDRVLLPMDDLQDPTADATGRGNAGTLVNGPTWRTGKFGSAIEFDGVNQCLDCGTSGLLNLTKAVSIEAWINPGSLPYGDSGTHSREFIVSKGRDGNAGYHLAILPTGRVRSYIVTSSGLHATPTSNALTTETLNTWHHVVMTYESGAGGSVWLDGVKTATGQWGDIRWSDGTGDYADESLVVGAHSYNAPALYFFDGLIDEVAVYSYALTDGDVLYRWNDGDGRVAAAIPEPSTFVLAGLGVLGLAVFGRRCR